MDKDYLFKVKTIKDSNGLFKGSVIYVEKELKKHYKGMCGPYITKVPKDKCVILDNLE